MNTPDVIDFIGLFMRAGTGLLVALPPVVIRTAGFSLLEVLVAIAILTTGAASLAQLFTASAAVNRSARSASVARLLAGQKMEQLRWDPLNPSPSDSLQADRPGYFDYLDASGAPLGGWAPVPPAGTAYVRRWSIEPLAGTNAVVLQVVVRPSTGRRPPSGFAGGPLRAPDGARLVGLMTRRAG